MDGTQPTPGSARHDVDVDAPWRRTAAAAGLLGDTGPVPTVFETMTGLAAERNLRATFYLGDDVTDETVFTTLRAGSDIGVKVGDGDTAAAHRVPGCTDVPTLLDALLGALTKARRYAPRDDADVRDDADAGEGAVSAPEAGR